MTPEQLFDAVEAHQDLEGVSIDPQTGVAVIRHIPTGLKTEVDLLGFDRELDDIMPVLLQVQDPVPLSHMTRVVGYYSRVENWNKSKVGELKDRHRGNYGLPVA